jgi:hypothetical protein
MYYIKLWKILQVFFGGGVENVTTFELLPTVSLLLAESTKAIIKCIILSRLSDLDRRVLNLTVG